jgi:hypothetical protein
VGVVELEPDDRIVKLKVVAQEAAKAGRADAAGSEHRPLVGRHLGQDRRVAQREGDQGLRRTAEIGGGAGVACLPAGIEAVPAEIGRIGRHHRARSAQGRRLEGRKTVVGGECGGDEADEAQSNEQATHNGLICFADSKPAYGRIMID